MKSFSNHFFKKNKLHVLIILMMSVTLCVKIFSGNKCRKNTAQEKAIQERVKLLMNVQQDLKQELRIINEKLKEKYQSIHSVIEKLKKLEFTHQTTLEFEQLINKMQKKLKEEKEEKKANELNEAHQFAEASIREIEKAYTTTNSYVKTLSENLDKLFGSADGLFKKAHIIQAQNNIEQATKKFNHALTLN